MALCQGVITVAAAPKSSPLISLSSSSKKQLKPGSYYGVLRSGELRLFKNNPFSLVEDEQQDDAEVATIRLDGWTSVKPKQRDGSEEHVLELVAKSTPAEAHKRALTVTTIGLEDPDAADKGRQRSSFRDLAQRMKRNKSLANAAEMKEDKPRQAKDRRKEELLLLQLRSVDDMERWEHSLSLSLASAGPAPRRTYDYDLPPLPKLPGSASMPNMKEAADFRFGRTPLGEAPKNANKILRRPRPISTAAPSGRFLDAPSVSSPEPISPRSPTSSVGSKKDEASRYRFPNLFVRNDDPTVPRGPSPVNNTAPETSSTHSGETLPLRKLSSGQRPSSARAPSPLPSPLMDFGIQVRERFGSTTSSRPSTASAISFDTSTTSGFSSGGVSMRRSLTSEESDSLHRFQFGRKASLHRAAGESSAESSGAPEGDAPPLLEHIVPPLRLIEEVRRTQTSLRASPSSGGLSPPPPRSNSNRNLAGKHHLGRSRPSLSSTRSLTSDLSDAASDAGSSTVGPIKSPRLTSSSRQHNLLDEFGARPAVIDEQAERVPP